MPLNGFGNEYPGFCYSCTCGRRAAADLAKGLKCIWPSSGLYVAGLTVWNGRVMERGLVGSSSLLQFLPRSSKLLSTVHPAKEH